MDVKTVGDNNRIFEGRIIVKNKISAAQNNLLNLHKAALEQKVKDLPFDVFVEQSKSRKTISVYADVKDANKYIVRKNNQNFEQIADIAISDGKKKSEAYKKLLMANELFNYQKLVMYNIVTGNFKQARKAEKELAGLGIENFDVFKEIPRLSVMNVPFSVIKKVMVQSFKYRIYRAFSSKTKEEKEFTRLKKEYVKQLKSEKKEIKTVAFNFQSI